MFIWTNVNNTQIVNRGRGQDPSLMCAHAAQVAKQRSFINYGWTFPLYWKYLCLYSAEGGFLSRSLHCHESKYCDHAPGSCHLRQATLIHPVFLFFILFMSLTPHSPPPRSKCQTAEGPIQGRKLIIQDERKTIEDSVCQWSKKKKTTKKL